jgi:hypothetical protein
MLERLWNYKPDGFYDTVMKEVVQALIRMKVKFGLNIDAKEIAYELHRPIRHKFQRRKVYSNYIDHIHSGDLIDFTKEHKGYVLVNIDIFSKYAWIFFIKNKTPEEIIKCYKEIFKDRKPELLWWDNEKSIDSNKFKSFLEENKVKLYHSYSEKKACVAERLIRTLKENTERIKTEYSLSNKKFSYEDILPQVVKDYNNTYHTTIKMTPTEASQKGNEGIVQDIYRNKNENYNPKEGKEFKPRDKVRIYKYKYIFDKGTKARWTKEVFIIDKVQNTKPKTYLLKDLKGEDIIGAFYSYELIKSNTGGGSEEGTTVEELKEIISRIQWRNPCLGIVLKDEIKYIPKQDGFIIALMINSTSSQISSHWVLGWKKLDEKVYFSSFGDEILPEMKEWLGSDILTNDLQVQPWNSSSCAQYCVLVAYCLDQGIQFEDIILTLLE